MDGRLTPKQARFAAEYLIDGNATRAAAAAGFGEKGAHAQGSRLLKNAKVAAAITEGHARRAKKLEISAERVLEELAKLAYYDPGDLYDGAGNRIPVNKLDADIRAAVCAVDDDVQESLGEADAEGIKPPIITRKQKIKMADKIQALDRLGRYLKLLTDKFESSGPGGGPIEHDMTVTFVRPERAV